MGVESSLVNGWVWFFVASYVVTDNNKLTKKDVDNYLRTTLWEVEHVKN